MTEGGWHFVGRLEDSTSGCDRLHAQVEGRYVTVVRHAGRLHCMDAVCFHAGGPLALGDVEELPSGEACLKCPWHYYLVALSTGDKWYQGTLPSADGKLLPGPWKSVGQRQRTHEVEQRADGVYVRLSLGGALASDKYAYKPECGLRIQSGHLRLSPQHLHASGGGEGQWPLRAGPPSPGSPASPRGSPPASPMYHGEGEDVWPRDMPEPPSHGRRAPGTSAQP